MLMPKLLTSTSAVVGEDDDRPVLELAEAVSTSANLLLDERRPRSKMRQAENCVRVCLVKLDYNFVNELANSTTNDWETAIPWKELAEVVSATKAKAKTKLLSTENQGGDLTTPRDLQTDG